MTVEQIQALKTILRENGGTVESVVRVAEDPVHPLHTCFNWDDRALAHQQRLAIARRLIQEVRYTVWTEQHVFEHVPSYVRDPSKDSRQQGYIVLKEASAQDAKAILLTELQRLRAYVSRAHSIAAAGMPHLVKFFDPLLKALAILVARVEQKPRAKKPLLVRTK